MLYAETSKADKDQYSFEVVYDVIRRQSSPHMTGTLKATERQRLVSADRLVPITGLPAELAVTQVASVNGSDYEKGRALYEYVLAQHALRQKRHRLGTRRYSLRMHCEARQLHGFPFPLYFHGAIAAHIRTIRNWLPNAGGQAFWRDPRLSLLGRFLHQGPWLGACGHLRSVEASGATEFFFGHWDDNRVQFSVGRDITFSPKQDGEPLNYFVYPYVELDHKEYPNVSNSLQLRRRRANQFQSRRQRKIEAKARQ